MKSTARLNTLTVLGLGALTALPASAQDELRDERDGVCGFTLQADNADVYRTNDWELTDSSDNGRLTRAQLYITSPTTGRMYGGSGERCGFDPYLECDDDTDDEDDRSPFVIASNSSLTFDGQAVFYLCNRDAFYSTDPDDQDDPEDLRNPDDLEVYPFIYPPVGTTRNRQRNYENCTAVQLTASGCQEDSSNAFTVSPTEATRTPNPTGTGTGSGSGTDSTATSDPGTTAAGASDGGTTSAASQPGLERMWVAVGAVLLAATGLAWL